MSSPARQHLPLQAIAEDVLQSISRGFLNPKENPDWVSSIMRQWVSYEGHAGVLTPTHRFWLELTRHSGGYNVEAQHVPGSAVEGFLPDWNIDPALVPRIIADLNLLQVSEFENRDGVKLRLRLQPHERRVCIEQGGAAGE